MAGAVAEALAIAFLSDDIAGHRVNIAAFQARSDGRLRGLLRMQDNIVDFAHLIGGLAHRHGARHIGTVAIHLGAKVHGHHVAQLNHAIARHGMRK